jgi:CheY-like chemotaxis protein
MHGKKILVVDDDAVFTIGFSMLLHAEGFEVVTAGDAASTLTALNQGLPDLILMDIFFTTDVERDPNSSWDGFGIMCWLRSMGEVGNTPVILLTASDQAEHVGRAKDSGAIALFQKSVETAELMDVIHQLLG